MDLVSFLGWKDSNGIYRSEINGELYRVVDSKLETFVSEILEWRESIIRVNKLDKIKPMKKVGTWSDGFAIHSKEEWGLAKTYYLEKGYKISNTTLIKAHMYLEYNIIFYVFLCDGEVETTTKKEIVKNDLISEPIDWERCGTTEENVVFFPADSVIRYKKL